MLTQLTVKINTSQLDTTERLHFHFSLSGIGEGNGNPLQCSCLENPRDGGAWWAAVYGIAQSQTRLKQLSSSSSSSLSLASYLESFSLLLYWRHISSYIRGMTYSIFPFVKITTTQRKLFPQNDYLWLTKYSPWSSGVIGIFLKLNYLDTCYWQKREAYCFKDRVICYHI